MRCFPLRPWFGNPNCTLIVLVLSIPLNICGYTCGYNILHKDILYNFNVLVAEQTEAWTHLVQFLEQLSLRHDLCHLASPYNGNLLCPLFLSALSHHLFSDNICVCLYNAHICDLG